MGYHGPRRVDLVEFVLEGRAQLWYDNLQRSRPAGAAPLTLEEFEDLLMREFLPETVRLGKAYEFERLTHEDCGSVDGYANRFLELSVYSPGLVATEKQKVDRFVYGLRKDVRRVMAGQTYATLTEAMDRARRVELWDKEGESSEGNDPRKRFKPNPPPQGQKRFQTQQQQNRGNPQGVQAAPFRKDIRVREVF